MDMLDCYTFEGQVEFETFTGPEEWPIGFTLMLAPGADPWLLNQAAKALGQFLIAEHYLKKEENDIMEDDE